jgi:hypothetical protein
MRAANTGKCLLYALLALGTLHYLTRAAGQPFQSPPSSNSSRDFWGKPTNGLCAGISCRGPEILVSIRPPTVLNLPTLELTNLTPNSIRFFWPPPWQRDEIAILDASGLPVPRTERGKLLGKPLPKQIGIRAIDAQRQQYYLEQLGPHSELDYQVVVGQYSQGTNKPPVHETTLDLTRFFALTNPGCYTLTRQARVCFSDTNNVLRLVTLPAVTVPLRVLESPP